MIRESNLKMIEICDTNCKNNIGLKIELRIQYYRIFRLHEFGFTLTRTFLKLVKVQMVRTMPEKGTITLLGIYKTPPFPSSSITLSRQMLYRKFSIKCYNWLLVHFLLWHDFVHSFFRNFYRHSFCLLLFPNNVKIWDDEQRMIFVNIGCLTKSSVILYLNGIFTISVMLDYFLHCEIEISWSNTYINLVRTDTGDRHSNSQSEILPSLFL